jgi:hypothetical protein
MRTGSLVALVLAVVGSSASAQQLSPKKTYPKFAIGPTGIYATIEPGNAVTVQEIRPGTPAAVAMLQAGDILVRAAGRSLEVADPRVPLGEAIGAAEADDGSLELEVIRSGGEPVEVTLTLPALGAYNDDWSGGGKKPAAIIAANAKYIVGCQQPDGSYKFGDERPERDGLTGCLAGIFLLSTGDATLLPNVQRQARALALAVEAKPTLSNWHLGYQGILLGEYYLKTGDQEVLPGLKALCDQAVIAQAAGGWGHGGIPNPGYTQSGLMSSAGIPVLTTLILARECGIEVDEAAYVRAVKFIYRMVGHGCVPYGDHRSELWWSNTNGRNAQVACALSLLDEPRFQKASRHLATLVADSYYQPEFGHTGGGFNVIWRGMASVHVPEDRQSHYHRQMRKLAWYYDLCRQPGGGFSILPTPPDNARYSGLAWGTGAMGLTYTAPLATLRITGAPRTRFSVDRKPVDFSWGTEADLAFLGTDDADGFGRESAEPHEVYALLIGDESSKATVGFCAQHLRHFSPLVRTWAARRLKEFDTPEAHAALSEAVGHADPRVRRAVYDALSGYDNWSRPPNGKMPSTMVSETFLPAILKTLNDSEAAWWELDGALFALGRALPADIRAAWPQIEKFSTHDEWYLREAAFWAIIGLGNSINGDEFNKLAAIYGASRHVFERSSYDAGFKAILRGDPAALDRASLSEAVHILGRTTHDVPVALGYGIGGVHEAAHRTMMILNHFDAEVFKLMGDDFAAYLRIWEPYYQHSVWLISGSGWQPGVLKVLSGLGDEGAPLVDELKKILARYDRFDKARIGGDAKDLEEKIANAVAAWETKVGTAK